jgi:eukaryotic-like serine/threonine-protein kinase
VADREAGERTTHARTALISFAHRHGVIHRDIKPENILLHDGRAMVMDFGIALAVSAAAGGRITETGLPLGTPHYMSPDQGGRPRFSIDEVESGLDRQSPLT